METKKSIYKRVTRLCVSLLCCLPVFVIINTLLEGAKQWLLILIDMIIGALILFTVEKLAERKQERLEQKHQEYLKEKKERERLNRISKGNTEE